MSDGTLNDLEAASRAIDRLAQPVDVDGAWCKLGAAVTRRNRARRAIQATSLVIAAAIVGSIGYAVRPSNRTTRLRVETPSSTSIPTECKLPPLPGIRADRSSSGGAEANIPKVSQSGAVLSQFELDGGRVRIDPADTDSNPAVSANEAVCAALASVDADGALLQSVMSAGGRIAVGYGLVTVDPDLVAATHKGQMFPGQVNENTQPTLPDATPYERRLAWVVIVRDSPFQIGTTSGPSSHSPTPTNPAGHDYLFIVDAITGSDALLYEASTNSPAHPTVIVPAELVSVPWTLLSRDPGGYAATLEASVLPCDGYPNPVNVPDRSSLVAVVVQRPVGASCGADVQVEIPVHASTVTGDLPARLEHAPLGPYIVPTPTGAQSPTQTTNAP